MWYENTRLRRIVILSLLALVFIFILIQLHNFFSTGRLTVKTSNPSNYVKIEWVVGGNQKPNAFSKQAQGKLSVSVKPGTYQLSVYDVHGISGSSRTVKIKARQSLSFTLDPVTLTNPTPVYGSKTNSVFSDGSQLLFVAPESLGGDSHGDGHLMQVGQDNQLVTLFPGNDFSEVKWANVNLGVAQDRFNNLYTINNGVLSQVKPPFPTNQNSKLSSDISADGTIYISDGKDVYVGTVAGDFRKIYTADTDTPVSNLDASTNKVAIIMNEVEALESKRNGNEPEGGVAVINNSGSHIQKSVDASQAIWSPGGKHLIVEGPLSATVYDTSLRQTAVINVNDSTNFTWLDANSVLYSIGSQLWTYNLQTHLSHKLTQLAQGENLTGIYPSADGSYVYFSDDNGEKTQLFRAGLKGQPVDKSFNALAIFMPETVGTCSFNYINFTQPTILIDYLAGQTPQACTDSAKQEASYYSLNVFKMQFQPQTQDSNRLSP